MMAFAAQDTQRKLYTIGTAGLVVVAALSLIAVAPALGGGPPSTSAGLYNVTFVERDGSADGASGSASFLSTDTARVVVNRSNLTLVVFHISYQDQSVSPIFDPLVTAVIQGPDNSGGATGQVTPGSTTAFPVTLDNPMPENGTVQAGSPEEAVDQVTPDGVNTTAGSGEWTVTLDVGAPLGGRIRPSGGITYTITVELMFFEGTATKV